MARLLHKLTPQTTTMRNFYTVTVSESESLNLYNADGSYSHRSYVTGVGVGQSTSPRKARELAWKRCSRDLYEKGLKAGWGGIGGTLILRDITITDYQGRVLRRDF